MNYLFDVLGLAGVSISLCCYARVQWQREYAKQISFSLLNLASSLLLSISLLYKWNLAAFTNNFIWGVISIYGVCRSLKK